MANWIPKLTYTCLTDLTAETVIFSSPPEGDPFNEETKSQRKMSLSSDGTSQTQWNYNEQIYNVEFTFQTSSVRDDMIDFIKKHAYKGGVFDYYPSSDEADYETYQLVGNSFKEARPIPDGSGDFEYNFKFKIRRTLDLEYFDIAEVGIGAITETQFTIVNNTGPADVTGLAFNGALIRGARIDYSIRRQHTTPNSEVTEFGNVLVVYNTTGTSWDIVQDTVGDASVTLSITSAGQIQYTSSDISGSVSVSAMRFRASTIAVEA